MPPVVINEEKFRKLETMLGNFSGLLDNSEAKDQITKAFRFIEPTATLYLYEKNSERIERFVEQLSEFFFAGRVYFEPKSGKSTFSGVIILIRFRCLFDVAINCAKKHNGRLDKVPDLARILSGKSLKGLSQYRSEKRFKQLKQLLFDYQYLFTDGYAIRHVKKAFKSKKPTTSITLEGIKTEIVAKFIEELEEFFFVDSSPELRGRTFTGLVFVSRTKNTVAIMKEYSNEYEGTFDRSADLSGFLLLGYPPVKIARYCLDERLKELNLIK